MRKQRPKSKIHYVDGFLAAGGVLSLGASMKVAWPALIYLGAKIIGT